MPVCITAVQSNDRFQGRLFPTQPFLRCDTRAFIIRYSGKYQMSPWIPVSAGCTNRCTPSPSSFSFVRLRPPNFLSYIFLTPNCPCFPPPSSYPSPPAFPIPVRRPRPPRSPSPLPLVFRRDTALYISAVRLRRRHCASHGSSSCADGRSRSFVRSGTNINPPPPPQNPSEMDASQVKSCSSPSQSTTSERRDALHSCAARFKCSVGRAARPPHN